MLNNKQLVSEIEQYMLPFLDNEQLEHLHIILSAKLNLDDHTQNKNAKAQNDECNADLMLNNFISAKRVEGCSDKTLKFYSSTLRKAFAKIEKKNIKKITTEDLRKYLDNYADSSHAGKVTIDNMRRILSSFFNWLE